MFKFLKETLKKAVNVFSKKAEEEAEDAVVTKEDVEEQEKKIKEKKAKKEKKPAKKEEKAEKETKERPSKKPVEKKRTKAIPKKEEKKEEVLEEKEKETKENIDLLDKVIDRLDEDIESASEKVKGEAEEKEEVKEKEEPEILGVEEKKEAKKEGFFSRLFKKKEEVKEEAEEKEAREEVEEEKSAEKKEAKKEKKKEEKAEEKEEVEEAPEEAEEKEAEEEKEEVEEEERPKRGFFGKLAEGLVAKTLSEKKFEELFFELEVALLENNVAVEVIEKIKEDLKKELVDKKLNRFDIEKIIGITLQDSLSEILDFEKVDIIQMAKKKKPFVIVFVGVNGSGKTTTIGKMAKYFEKRGMKSVMVAADTFRAAAIQQLEEHANRLNVKIIKHDYGSDPAAVAFDGIKYAEAKGIDVVLIDTAGRLHSNVNLIDEMKKIIRVAKPDMKLFIGESITGNDCIEQAQKFNEAVDIDGIILSKADVDEKGGAAISVSYVTGKPILFIGNGQNYEDLQEFDKEIILKNLGLAEEE